MRSAGMQAIALGHLADSQLMYNESRINARYNVCLDVAESSTEICGDAVIANKLCATILHKATIDGRGIASSYIRMRYTGTGPSRLGCKPLGLVCL